jgi:putative glutamine transport system substrate-binding protein
MKRLLTFFSWVIMLSLVLGLVAGCGPTPVPPTPTKAAPTKAPEGTLLRKIQDRGKLILGVKYDVPLFGYMNPQTNQLEGFDVALGKEIAKKIFGDETKVEFKQAVSKDRIPFLQQDVVDLIISTMTITEAREKEIDFSEVYYLAGQSLLVPKGSPIKSIADLEGRTVASVKGSTSEKNIREKAPKANVILFDSYSECVTAMVGKRAEAVTTDDIILAGFASQNKDLTLVGGLFTYEPYGIGIKKGNKELVDLVNGVIRDLKASGRWKEIYTKEIGDKAGIPAPVAPISDWREIMKSAPK